MRLARTALFGAVIFSAVSACAQDQGVTIRTETRLVLVDAVVTDKKGAYITDLEAKDFKIWEDGKEQAIVNCTFEGGAAPSHEVKRHLLFVFDYQNMQPGDQIRSQEAAEKFIDANVGPNRLMAVATFTQGVTLSPFTADAKKLREAIAETRTVSSGTTSAAISTATAAMERSAPSEGLRRSVSRGGRAPLLAIRSLARTLGALPGRKIVVLFSPGFIENRNSPDMTAALDMCNRSNVSIYPVDLGGLTGGGPDAGASVFKPMQFLPTAQPMLLQLQREGGYRDPRREDGGRAIDMQGTQSDLTRDARPSDSPRFALEDIAKETGGFVLTATNDLFGAVEKIGREQDQYYTLSYSAPNTMDGSCHSLKVKVDRSGAVVRARSRYCNMRSPDLLAGTPVSRQLEAKLADPGQGDAGAAIRTPFFYTSDNTPRVNVAVDIPSKLIAVAKEKNRMRGAVSVLGVAYRPDGGMAARFSDTLKVDLEKNQYDALQGKPLRYENQFEIAPGEYTLKLAFHSGGDAFGKVETKLVIEPYDGKRIALASLALSNDIRNVGSAPRPALLEDKVPLVTRGLLMVPAGSHRFNQNEQVTVYTEVYDPLLAQAPPPDVGVVLKIKDKKTGVERQNSGLVKVTGMGATEGTKVTVGLNLPIKALGPGAYVLEVMAVDSLGNQTPSRAVDLEVE